MLVEDAAFASMMGSADLTSGQLAILAKSADLIVTDCAVASLRSTV
jgi:hypothetical protein